MEDVLDLYAQPPDARRPLVCFDERPVQLVAHTRTPLPPAPGRPERVDYEYRRRGTCNLFTFFAPHLGWRHVEVTDRRTKVDFARMMKALVSRSSSCSSSSEDIDDPGAADIFDLPPSVVSVRGGEVAFGDGSLLSPAGRRAALIKPQKSYSLVTCPRPST